MPCRLIIADPFRQEMYDAIKRKEKYPQDNARHKKYGPNRNPKSDLSRFVLAFIRSKSRAEQTDEPPSPRGQGEHHESGDINTKRNRQSQ